MVGFHSRALIHNLSIRKIALIFTDCLNLNAVVLKFTYAKKNISTEKNKKNQEARFSVKNENESGERCFEKKKTDG